MTQAHYLYFVCYFDYFSEVELTVGGRNVGTGSEQTEVPMDDYRRCT